MDTNKEAPINGYSWYILLSSSLIAIAFGWIRNLIWYQSSTPGKVWGSSLPACIYYLPEYWCLWWVVSLLLISPRAGGVLIYIVEPLSNSYSFAFGWVGNLTAAVKFFDGDDVDLGGGLGGCCKWWLLKKQFLGHFQVDFVNSFQFLMIWRT